jgi:integrase
VVTRSFTTRSAADSYIATVGADKVRGIVIDPRRGQVTFKVYAIRWIDDRTDLAERTVELYRHLLEHHIEPTFGSKALSDVSPSAVRVWHAEIAHEHKTTAAKAYRLLSSMMKTAVADEIIARNPCHVKGAGVEKAPERPVASIAEVDALAAAMPDHLQIAVLLAAWCQLRRGEMLGLRRRDVDLLRDTVSVSVTRTPTMAGKSVEKAPKTDAGRRTVSIPSNVVQAIEDHLDAYVGPDPDDPVLVGKQGGPVGSRVLQTAWDKARAKVDRTDLRQHDIRHSGLTWSAATGASTAELMRRAGHTSPTAALRYQHATQDRDRVLADALADLAGDAPMSIWSARQTRDKRDQMTGKL